MASFSAFDDCADREKRYAFEFGATASMYRRVASGPAEMASIGGNTQALAVRFGL